MLAGQAGLCERCNALSARWHKRLINITRRSATSNRYFIAWQELFWAYRHQQVFERDATAASRRRHEQKVAGEVAKSGGSHPPEVAAEPRKEPMKENLRHEMAHPPSAADAKVSSMNERESLESLTTYPQVESQQGHSEEDRVTLTPEGQILAEQVANSVLPPGWWEEKLAKLKAELDHTTDFRAREQLKGRIAKAKSYLKDHADEQRGKAGSG